MPDLRRSSDRALWVAARSDGRAVVTADVRDCMRLVAEDDAVDPDSVRVWLQPEGGAQASLVEPGKLFAPGCVGRMVPTTDMQGKRSLAVFIDPRSSLKPDTGYAAGASARLPRPLVWTQPISSRSICSSVLPFVSGKRRQRTVKPVAQMPA